MLLLAACGDDNYTNMWKEYQVWRDQNDLWILEQRSKTNPDGSLYYETVIPEWNPNAYVLMRYLNDTTLTKDNLVPLYTSTVAVKYEGKLINDTIFDNSYSLTDSLFVTTPGGVISGWTIALQNMHVGDSCEVIIPYQEGYNTSSAGVIPPFSVLRFNMKLVDIKYYEAKP